MGNSNAIALIEEQDADITEPLNQQERKSLAACEKTITANICSFVKVGEALRAIRDRRLYRESYKTFEAYCRGRWDFSRAHAYRQMAAAETMKVLSPTGDILPTAETQVRSLLQFELDDRPQVWKDVQARLRPGASRCVTSQVNEIVQSLIRGSDDEPYRRRRTELKKAQREKLRRAIERDQEQMSRARVTSRRQEARLPDKSFIELEEITSELQKTFRRMKRRYDALEIPGDHAVEDRMFTIELSIGRLASWLSGQSEAKEAA